MAVNVIRRPQGYIRSSNDSPGITNESGGQPGVINIVSPAHGIDTGTVVYITAQVEDYAGFFSIEVADSNNFRLKNLEGDYVSFIPNTDGINVTFFALDTLHTWNCVHLPVVYKLSNTLWPANSADTVRTISSATDSNGYCNLSLSGDIKDSGSAAALEFVKITGDNDFNGVYQIISYSSETSFVIDLPYATLTAIDITNSQIQYYYNNYHVKVEVWGGLNNGHEYYAQEPYELLATLDLVPDENNEVKFSIHEILKKNIEIKNNLLLGTLPNNLDAWTGFFIKYAEVYDDSDGTTLSTITPSYTSDLTSFEGKAVNAILPFKNVYSGALSEYVSADSSQKFLTAFTRPTIFDGKYFDLSFLWEGVSNVIFLRQWYLNNVLQTSNFGDILDAFYTGVYRGELEANCIYDRVDVKAIQGTSTPQTSLWLDDGALDAFTSKTGLDLIYTDASSPYLQPYAYTPINVTIGDTIKIRFTIVLSGTFNGVIEITSNITQGLSTSITNGASITEVSAGSTTIESVFVITQTLSGARLAVLASVLSGTGSIDLTITVDPTYFHSTNIVSETKTIDINCDCLRSKATGYYLSWLNPYGGFDSWLFTGYADELIDIVDTGETEENPFPEWPNSYGEFADTQRKQTYRTSRRQRLIRSQHVTEAQLSAIENIKTSPLVQIVNSIYDRRTVLVDADSFVSLKEENNLHDISFTITYTDDVPSQKV